MKIYFYGFWWKFIENESHYYIDFFSKVFDLKIELADNIEDADILVESLWKTESLLDKKKWTYTFLYTPEGHYLNWWGTQKNQLEEYSCILGFNKTCKNYVCFPYFIPYISYNSLEYNPVTEVPKKMVCTVIKNSQGVVRNTFLDILEKHVEVIHGGQFRRNTPELVEGNWSSDSLIEFYKKYKFVICMENEQQDYYITEKIINGFRAGVIPIYWGSPNISKYFNSNRFINLEKIEDVEIVIDKILNMTDEEYLKIVNEPIFLKNKNDYLSEVIEDTKSCLILN